MNNECATVLLEHEAHAEDLEGHLDGVGDEEEELDVLLVLLRVGRLGVVEDEHHRVEQDDPQHDVLEQRVPDHFEARVRDQPRG